MSTITVIALRLVFRRAGFEFSREPRTLDCDQLTPEQLEAIEAEPQLVVSYTPEREGDAPKSGAGANSSRESTAAAGEPTSEAQPAGSTTAGAADDVPPNVDSGSRGTAAGADPSATGSPSLAAAVPAATKPAAAKKPAAKAAAKTPAKAKA
jgi:hypothetical protein